MLPDVDADDGHEVGADIRDWVLVGHFTVGEDVGALVVNEPSPARALDGSRALVKGRTEGVNAAPCVDDLVVQGAALWQVAVGLWAE